ncbi:Glycogen synthase, ADP-glucose transglucosylase [hydrothermal vent metagenome]|uniref:Glycogen synthase, ADP-glucose transglucosylase n=1 Tax=hydrothermal vent metagenome TaxID=652676 RepID=A0A3B1CUP9_9ZZZZ
MSVKLQNKNSPIQRVLHIAREFGPVAGAGGIKDVCWGLCKASAKAGIATEMFLPHYRLVDEYLLRYKLSPQPVCTFVVRMDYGDYVRAEKVTVTNCEIAPKLRLFLIKTDPFRYLAEQPEKKIPRHGIYQYTKEEALALGRSDFEGRGYADAFAQNVLLVKAVLLILARVSWRPDVVHCHDGHAALFPFIAQTSAEGYAPDLAHLPTLLTIHNAGKGYHQETRALDYVQKICGIDTSIAKSALTACLLEGAFDPLLAGGLYGTAVNTVSENYARELRETGLDAQTGWLGHRYSGLGLRLLGITNGIDIDSHHPNNRNHPALPVSFSPETEDWKGKAACKKKSIAQLKQFKDSAGAKKHGRLIQQSGRPLFSFVGRLTEQKGFDTLHTAMRRLLSEDEKVGLWGLGNGDLRIMEKFKTLANEYKGRVCFIEGYSEADAKKIYASGDFFLIPSRFEPCGLTDFIAQLNGNIPIVHRVGGLVKTIDNQYGFSYLGGADELYLCLKRAIVVYRSAGKKRLRTIQRDAFENIKTRFTWDKVLQEKYLPLYEGIVKKAKPVLPY